jgi:glutamate racemase
MTTTMTTPETRPAASPEATSQAAAPTIGVFDSGFGGLTVLRALIQRLPRARFAFLGDTARLPYGSKSRRTIARYAVQSAQFLVREQGAQFLVIACNTASALALDAIQDAVPVPVLGVIEPGASAARAASRTGDVLVIATDATVHSHAYAVACRAQGLRALEKACPLLVPLVEEGWTGASAFPASCTGPSAAQAASAPPQVAVTAEVIRIYLEELTAEAAAQGLNPDTLVLGCTHYPLLRPLLERILARAVPAGLQVIDSADSAADAAVLLFAQHNMEQRPPSAKDPSAKDPGAQLHIRCFATDSVDKFERLGSRFLGRPTGKVELVDLGG